MERNFFELNRDKIINDFYRQHEKTHVGKLMNALIIFEAITQGEGAMKVFNDKAIEAQHILIEFCVQTGSYQPTIPLT